MKLSKKTLALALIIIVAAVIRLYDLPHGDPVSDEVLYGFRAIGYMDFDFAIAQPTPLQLFEENIPAWTKLSFHDHPPLVFLAQHWFMKIFGVNLWGLRLSSAFFGIGAVYALYLIGRKLFSESVGLISAAFLGATVLAVYTSRVAVQESQVIFFVLLTFFLFLKTRDDPRWYIATGLSFGAALISKYTAGVLVLPLLIFLVIYDRKVFRSRWLWFGAGVALLVFSPVIIYNIMLYRTFGHFDFQLFYIFKQSVPYWQDTPGKEIGSVFDRIVGIPKNLWVFGSVVSTILGTIAFLWLIVMSIKKKWLEQYTLLLLLCAGTLFMFLAIGPAPRFLTMVIPWIMLIIGVVLSDLLSLFPKRKFILISFVILAVIAELGISLNTTFANEPVGVESIHFSKIHNDMRSWGYNALDSYLEIRTHGKYSELIIPYRFPFLEDIKDRAIEEAKRNGYTPERTLFIFNENMSDLATLWVIHRRALYQAWPMIGASNYQETLQNEGDDFYRNAGFVSFVFIQNDDSVLKNYAYRLTDSGDMLEIELRERGIEPERIIGPSGAEAFRVYTFQ